MRLPHRLVLPQGAGRWAALLCGAAALFLAIAFPIALGSAVEPASQALLGAVGLVLSLALVLAVLCEVESSRLAVTTLLLLVPGTPLWDALAVGWPLSRLVAFGVGALFLVLLSRMRADPAGRWPAIAGALAGAVSLLSPTGASIAIGAATLVLAETGLSRRRRAARVVLTLMSAAGAAALGWLVFGVHEELLKNLGNPLSAAGIMALIESLFRSPDGILYRSPLLWLAGLGGVLILRRDTRVGLAFGATVLSALLIAAALRDSAARFDAMLPLLALGLSRGLAVAMDAARHRPLLPLALGSLAFVLWNVLLMEQYRSGRIARDDTVSFVDVTANSASLLSEAFGPPPAWPASWYVAQRYAVPLDRVDALVGRRLFSSPGERSVAISLAGAERDGDLLLEGWSSPRPRGDRFCRRILGQAELIVPLAVREDLEVGIVWVGQGPVVLAVQGVSVAELPAQDDLVERHVRVAAAYWHPPFTRLALIAGTDAAACVEQIVLTRREERAP
jgi:hypothetical protein